MRLICSNTWVHSPPPPFFSSSSSSKAAIPSRWFHGNLDTKEAQRKLTGQLPGTFLVRFSTNTEYPGAYTITRVASNGMMTSSNDLFFVPFLFFWWHLPYISCRLDRQCTNKTKYWGGLQREWWQDLHASWGTHRGCKGHPEPEVCLRFFSLPGVVCGTTSYDRLWSDDLMFLNIQEKRATSKNKDRRKAALLLPFMQ